MNELIKSLKRDGILKTYCIIDSFLKNDRRNFVLPEFNENAYVDAPLPIIKGQTISQPRTVALMLELLEPTENQKILDVGFGSGWTTALLSSIVGKNGKVFAMELLPEVYDLGKENLKKFDRHNIELRHGSGWDGWKEHQPFDRILVSAAAEEVPVELKKQLKIGGKMVIPVGKRAYKGNSNPVKNTESWKEGLSFVQSLKLICRVQEEEFEETDFSGFAFVPLVR